MIELPGLWFDGRASRARPVRVRLLPGLLSVDGLDDATPCDWPIQSVAISPRLGRTPRVLRLPNGARIEVADSPSFTHWLGRPVGGMEQAADWLERRRAAVLVAAVSTVVATLAFLHSGVPWLAGKAATHVPAVVERQAARQVVALLRRTGMRTSTLGAARQVALQRQFRRLVGGEPRAQEMRLVLVHAPSIGPNAFALPDGRIYLTDELVAITESDAELMAVLAHEAGHHVHRHAMRQALESSSVFLLAGVLLGDVSGSSLAVSLPAVLLSNGFSRGHEREADDYAFSLLEKRGVSPRAFATVMRRLMKRDPAAGGGPIGYLSTHPPTPERIAAAERAARR
ncbi:MAG: M48 family metallopeptidase [Luteimonas sp.]